MNNEKEESKSKPDPTQEVKKSSNSGTILALRIIGGILLLLIGLYFYFKGIGNIKTKINNNNNNNIIENVAYIGVNIAFY